MRKFLFAAIFSAALSAGVFATAAGATQGHNNVDLCHATSSATNPYVQISVDPASVVFEGHDGHSDDIIPPFSGYLGKNWTSDGQAIWSNECQKTPATTSTTQVLTSTTSTSIPSTSTTIPETTTSSTSTTQPPGSSLTTTTIPPTVSTTTVPVEAPSTTQLPPTVTSTTAAPQVTIPEQRATPTAAPSPATSTTVSASQTVDALPKTGTDCVVLVAIAVWLLALGICLILLSL